MNENNKCEHGLANGLTYLLIGGGIGAALALLFAPKSGSELRGNIADVTRKGYDATLEKAHDLKAQSAAAIESVKDKATAVYDFAATKINAGTEAATEAVSAARDTVAEGLDRIHGESTQLTKPAANGRKGANIV